MDLRIATMDDVPALNSLIAASARELSAGFYTQRQIEALVTHVFGVDTQLISDGTYFVVDGEDAADGPVAAGGWSARRTLYGGDQAKEGEDTRLDPSIEAARIRAFFVHPRWARRGLGRRLYNECERAALAVGFRNFELMATLPGEPLYAALGFASVERVTVRLPASPIDASSYVWTGEVVDVPLVKMQRRIV